MNQVEKTRLAENFYLCGNTGPLKNRIENSVFLSDMSRDIYFREIVSPVGRMVKVRSSKGVIKDYLMFGSNNYLGLADSPEVFRRVIKICQEFGTGLGGPATFSGTTTLHKILERKISQVKGTEDTMLLSSGYSANLAWVAGLVTKDDLVIADSLAHASFIDGTKLAEKKVSFFRHNNIRHLEKILTEHAESVSGDIYVYTESLFSMDGVTGKIDDIVRLKKKFRFILVVDDAHGLGVLGEKGCGVHEHFDTGEIDIIIGTLSKTLAVTGGSISGRKDVLTYLKMTARPTMFSTALPPVTLATALAGLEMIEEEPWRVKALKNNIVTLRKLFQDHGISADVETAIVSVLIGRHADVLSVTNEVIERGFFLNTVLYPAVPVSQQRFRISLSALHTEQDLRSLVNTLSHILN